MKKFKPSLTFINMCHSVRHRVEGSLNEKHELDVEDAYLHAAEIISTCPASFVNSELNIAFESCPLHAAFAYDHLRECYRRDSYISYDEYVKFSQRFPRAR
jgi:hypothetical protein